jgi:uracil-DNA glycosylase family 4
MNGVKPREAAFLAEMGIGPLWSLRRAQADAAAEVHEAAPAPHAQAPGGPEPALVRAADAVAQPAAEAAAPAARMPRPGEPGPRWAPPPPPAPPPPTGPTADEIARMDWDELRTAVAECTRCGCKDGRKPVFGAGAVAAKWFVAAGATSAADEQAGVPLAGDAGKLLDNMLAAVGLSRERDVYVTNLVKCRPASANGGDRAPSADEAAACRPFVERELALTGAGTVLTLGQIAANGLLGKPLQEPLAGARGSVHALGGVPLVATLHPGELLRRGADKALAWADLCRAKAAHAGRG